MMEKPPGECEPGGTLDIRLHERRQRPRIACKARAEAIVAHPEALFRGEIRDVSESGCFIGTHARLQIEPGTEIDLRFSLHGARFCFDAEVASIREGEGFGLRFIRADDAETIQALTHLIQEELNRSKESNPPPKADPA